MASAEFQEYGPWVAFSENDTGSPYYGQQVYFDQNGNQYLVGQGPVAGLANQGNIDTQLVAQVNQQMAIENGTQTTYMPINAASASSATAGTSSSLVSDIQYLLTSSSLVSGMPNWVLMIGAAIGFIWANRGK